MYGGLGYIAPTWEAGELDWLSDSGLVWGGEQITIADIGRSREAAEEAGEYLAPLDSFTDLTQDFLGIADAAALADSQADAEGRPRPSEVAPIEIVYTDDGTGVSVVNGAPAFEGLADQIATSRTGDFLESVGLPRESAPWIIGGLVLAGVAWAVQAQGG